jgi:hypothetical protein
MILADFQCKACGVHERIVDSGMWHDKCPTCGRKTKRIMSVSGVYTGNQDGSYAKESAAALLDMDAAKRSPDPLERELAANPNPGAPAKIHAGQRPATCGKRGRSPTHVPQAART